MATTTDPGIAIEQIRLLKSDVEMVNPDGKREYSLCIIGLSRIEPPGGNTLDFHVAFDLMHQIENPVFKFTCEFIARYTRRDDSSMTWENFTSPLAFAHVIPYLREYVSNITNRLPTSVVILKPMNTYAMIADYEQRKALAVKNTGADCGGD